MQTTSKIIIKTTKRENEQIQYTVRLLSIYNLLVWIKHFNCLAIYSYTAHIPYPLALSLIFEMKFMNVIGSWIDVFYLVLFVFMLQAYVKYKITKWFEIIFYHRQQQLPHSMHRNWVECCKMFIFAIASIFRFGRCLIRARYIHRVCYVNRNDVAFVSESRITLKIYSKGLKHMSSGSMGWVKLILKILLFAKHNAQFNTNILMNYRFPCLH